MAQYRIEAMSSPAESVAAWQNVSHWIEDALKATPTIVGPSDIFRALQLGTMRLWAIFDKDSKPKAAFVTEIVSGARGRCLNVVALGGSEAPEWAPDITLALRTHAQEMGCQIVAEQGRPGWTRLLAKEGWEHGPATMFMKVA